MTQITEGNRTGTPGREVSGMQSLNRAFELLETLADAGRPLGVSALATVTGLPLPTIHRILRSLSVNGYVRQDLTRRYTLGAGLIPLGEAARHGLGVWSGPHLHGLVADTGETANLAVLDGDAAVYIAQAPSPHSMRMFTEVGHRVMLHCTGVGKVLLSQLDDQAALRIIERTGLPANTQHTLTTADSLLVELARIRERGYAVDDGEQEIGVRCVAVPVVDASGAVALSVSGPSARIGEDHIETVFVPALLRTAQSLSAEFRSNGDRA